MRIRQIKPEFWKDEDLAELPRELRLFYVGLWSLADRAGILEDRPRWIKAELFPYDFDLSPEDVDGYLDTLAQHPKAFIMRYEVGGKGYIAIPKMPSHQHFHKDERSRNYPPPPGQPQASTMQISTHEEGSTQLEPDRSEIDTIQAQHKHSANIEPIPDQHGAGTIPASDQQAGYMGNGDLDSLKDGERGIARAREGKFSNFAAKGYQYVLDLKNPNYQNLNWVLAYLHEQLAYFCEGASGLKPEHVLECWMDTWDKASEQGKSSIKWVKATFTGKVAEYRPSAKPTRQEARAGKSHLEKLLSAEKLECLWDGRIFSQEELAFKPATKLGYQDTFQILATGEALEIKLLRPYESNNVKRYA